LLCNSIIIDSFYNHPNILIKPLDPYYGKWAIKTSNKISGIKLVKSKRDMNLLSKKYKINAEYVPDGISKELLNKPNMAKVLRLKYDIQDPSVVFVSRLHELNGIQILIRSMALVNKENSNLKADIIGPGEQEPYKKLVNKLGIKNKVLFTGFVDEDIKIGTIDASIGLVLPSISDYVKSFSLAITEAWAREKPVIASAVGEIPYRVEHMVNGFLIRPRDAKALTEAIIILEQNKELNKKLGKEGRNYIFTWDNIIDKLLKIYQA
jgi:glycosyltransferase involved in cell wall biosynthesis